MSLHGIKSIEIDDGKNVSNFFAVKIFLLNHLISKLISCILCHKSYPLDFVIIHASLMIYFTGKIVWRVYITFCYKKLIDS